MLAAIALTPSAPVLLPELSGTAAAEVADLRAAAVAAAAALPDRWIAIGAGSTDRVWTGAGGTFAGYGVDVGVCLDPPPAASPGPATDELPLCALMAGWLRGQANPAASVTVRVYAADKRCQDALGCGRDLRARIDRAGEPIGVLVVADGANTLTPAAPGGFDPAAGQIQDVLCDALASGDTATLAALPDAIVGRVAYQVLAGLTGARPVSARELARGAPYGVGYFAGVWTP